MKRSVQLIPFVLMAGACSGGSIGAPNPAEPDPIVALSVFGGRLVNPAALDTDHDGVSNVNDLCALTAEATVDTDGDGLGDACDPNPTVNEYDSPPPAPGAEGAAEGYREEVNVPVTEAPSEDTASGGVTVNVRVARICRNEGMMSFLRQSSPQLMKSANRIVEILDQPLMPSEVEIQADYQMKCNIHLYSGNWCKNVTVSDPYKTYEYPSCQNFCIPTDWSNCDDDPVVKCAQENGLRLDLYRVETKGNVLGSAEMADVHAAYPTTKIAVADKAKLEEIIKNVGESEFLRRYVRVCEDKDNSGTCDVGETQYIHEAMSWQDMGTQDMRFDDSVLAFYMRPWIEQDVDHSSATAPGDPAPVVEPTSAPETPQPDDCDVSWASPLVFDLTGDGIRMSPPSVLFDVDGNGTRDFTTWLGGEDDVFLALDLDGNGVISSGRELFGNSTLINGVPAANGFEALKQYDSNHDGAITPEDPIFEKLLLWNDANRDGRSQRDELKPLSFYQIQSIALHYQGMKETDENGNVSLQRSTFVKAGEPRLVIDVWLSIKEGLTK
jgi:hypothetical protein